jgi:hypothetical protein
MRKCVFIALITILTLSMPAALCFGQVDRTVTSTSKKGSLLIWPLIKAAPADTTIMLGNNYYKSVKVRCSYRSSFPFQHTDWLFRLLPNQTISWLASTGKGPDGNNIPNTGANAPSLASGTAELRCWAVDSVGTQQIAWNWLSGEAVLNEGKNQNWGYSAWRFAVNSSTTGAAAGTAGQILLTGDSGNYDACPTALLFNFMKQTPTTGDPFPKGSVNNVLTLVPCMENFAKGAAPSAFTNLLVYDEAQTTVSGASACVGCNIAATQWFSEPLTSSKLILATEVINPFVNLATPGGSIYIHGKPNRTCALSSGVPLIGVMSMQLMSGTGPFVGIPPTAIGPAQGYVKDVSDVDTTTPISIIWQ